MTEVNVIRYRALVEEIPLRQLGREMGVARNTIRKYVREEAEPGKRKPANRRSPVLEKVRSRMDEILEASPRWTAGKQQLTASRLHAMLCEEKYEVSYTLVKEYFREFKRRKKEVFVPLEYAPGELAEVDFFEVYVRIQNEQRKAFLFVMRLMYSGRDFVQIYARQDQISFLDAHVRAFAHFGCIPLRIAYDNLKAAVAKILVGGRVLSPRFKSMADHYLLEPCFARPGEGHDKGGVEGRGGAIRRQHMVPIPEGESLEEMASLLQQRIDKAHTHAEKFAQEKRAMRPLPIRPFQAALECTVNASSRALVRVDAADYSVPSAWANRPLTALVFPHEVHIGGPDGTAVHPRVGRGKRCVDYRHFLKELARKPQALRQVADSLVASLGDPFGSLWNRLRAEYGGLDGARRFAQILRLIDSCGVETLRERIRHAMQDEKRILFVMLQNPVNEIPKESLPHSLREIEVVGSSALRYDALLGGAR